MRALLCAPGEEGWDHRPAFWRSAPIAEYSGGHNVPAEIRTILFDPQTAGGLLLSVARSDAASLLIALTSAGVPAVEI
jgi:selenophosphate synthase